MSNDERENLKSYAYYCGSYLSNIRKNEKIEKLNEQGFYQMKEIAKAKQLHGQKIEFIVNGSDSYFGGLNRYKGKLFWSPVDERLMAMKSRHRKSGWWVDNENVFIKLNK